MEKTNNNLTVTTPGVHYVTTDPDARIANLPEDHFRENLLSQIRLYVEQYGTIDKLAIISHGDSKSISSMEYGDTRRLQHIVPGTDVDIPDFLDALKKLQNELGVQIAKSIDFQACATLTDVSADFTPNDVKYFRKTASELGATITGALTDLAVAGGRDYINDAIVSQEGLRASFNPDGTVTRGPSYTSYRTRAALLYVTVEAGEPYHLLKTGLRALVYSDVGLEKASGAGWFDCHKGKSQEEGAACQAAQLPAGRTESRDLKELRFAEAAQQKGAQQAPTPDLTPLTLNN